MSQEYFEIFWEGKGEHSAIVTKKLERPDTELKWDMYFLLSKSI